MAERAQSSLLWKVSPTLQDEPVTLPMGVRLFDLAVGLVSFFFFNRLFYYVTPLSQWMIWVSSVVIAIVIPLCFVWARKGNPEGYAWSLLHWLELWPIPGAFRPRERHYDGY